MDQFEAQFDIVTTSLSRIMYAGLFDCPWLLAAGELAFCDDCGPAAQVGGREAASQGD
ncbi:hypothetical protein I6F09_15245 [Bradyrhizobium sp. IC3195]|uniref:hypothetical protein n=1 Tax=Bradyrhizobium sp. IC3195 TaxID=2793804 RepID=UPI001CD6CD1C|nr:hypothetical protein [Bradyrhizobium sp. IC3195]MCA1469248.1 hypothetical protein [Bradyrhizobium sp. IC3195]